MRCTYSLHLYPAYIAFSRPHFFGCSPRPPTERESSGVWTTWRRFCAPHRLTKIHEVGGAGARQITNSDGCSIPFAVKPRRYRPSEMASGHVYCTDMVQPTNDDKL